MKDEEKGWIRSRTNVNSSAGGAAVAAVKLQSYCGSGISK